jgi:hypothetical protein
MLKSYDSKKPDILPFTVYIHRQLYIKKLKQPGWQTLASKDFPIDS